jgi:hypothetical protein
MSAGKTIDQITAALGFLAGAEQQLKLAAKSAVETVEETAKIAREIDEKLGALEGAVSVWSVTLGNVHDCLGYPSKQNIDKASELVAEVQTAMAKQAETPSINHIEFTELSEDEMDRKIEAMLTLWKMRFERDHAYRSTTREGLLAHEALCAREKIQQLNASHTLREGRITELLRERADLTHERDMWQRRAEQAVTPQALTDEQIAYGHDVVAARIARETAERWTLSDPDRWNIPDRRIAILAELQRVGFDFGQCVRLIEMFVGEMQLAYSQGAIDAKTTRNETWSLESTKVFEAGLGAPSIYLISSAKVARVGAHDVVFIWGRGAYAGELTLQRGDGEVLGQHLMELPPTTEPDHE